jgi:hypothetical protein
MLTQVQIPFDTVEVFDVSSIYNHGDGVWYSQKTTGDVPKARVDFCAVSVSAPDNSSHNMYVFASFVHKFHSSSLLTFLNLATFMVVEIPYRMFSMMTYTFSHCHRSLG